MDNSRKDTEAAACGTSHLLLPQSPSSHFAQHPVSPSDVGWMRGQLRGEEHVDSLTALPALTRTSGFQFVD